MIRLLIAGGRDFSDREQFQAYLLDELEPSVVSGERIVLIHGAASGADHMADQWAAGTEVEVLRFPADWQAYGKSAGPIRNGLMIEQGEPDRALIFPGGPGTRDMMLKLFNAGIPFTFAGAPHRKEE